MTVRLLLVLRGKATGRLPRWDACLKGGFPVVELSLEGGKSRREQHCHAGQPGRWGVAMRGKRCPSKGRAVVHEALPKEDEISPSLCVSKHRE